jgi:hypothetical protein
VKGGIDAGVAVRSALAQAVAVAVLAVILALIFSHGFFEDFGWVVGPIAWFGCALITARVVGLPRERALAAALIAGVLSLVGVIVGAHWAGLAVAVIAFGLLCGHIEPD